MPVDTFVVVAFDDRWYLGQVAEVISLEKARGLDRATSSGLHLPT